MFDVTDFGLGDMIECGAAVRRLGEDATSMQEVAGRVVRFLYDNFVDKETGDRVCALVRGYKTHPCDDLPEAPRRFATGMAGMESLPEETKCLVLLATAGHEPEWNDPDASRAHLAIPLVGEDAVAASPMVSQLIKQFGLGVEDILDPDPAVVVDLAQTTFNVFHVADAPGSQWVPAQEDFVRPYGIRSVLGFGGVVPPGDLFAFVMFSRAPIDRETADMFRTIAVNAKVALLPVAERRVFA